MPKSRQRQKRSSRAYAQPPPKKRQKASPRWYGSLVLGLMALGIMKRSESGTRTLT